MFFVKSRAQLTLKCSQMCHFWTSRLASCASCGVISSNPVFERPYGGLVTFTNVSWTQKIKKPCTNTLQTYVVAHRGKNMPGKHQGGLKTPKSDTNWVPHGRPGRGLFRLFFPRCPYARPPGRENLKNMFLASQSTKFIWNMRPTDPQCGPNTFQNRRRRRRRRRKKKEEEDKQETQEVVSPSPRRISSLP